MYSDVSWDGDDVATSIAADAADAADADAVAGDDNIDVNSVGDIIFEIDFAESGGAELDPPIEGSLADVSR